MRDALALELTKLIRSRRNALYLALPNLYAIAFTGALLVAALLVAANTVSLEAFRYLAAGLAAFVHVHEINGLVVYPACALLLACQLWTAEWSDGTLRTLVLCQVVRWKILVAKVAVIGAVLLTGQVVNFGLFLAGLGFSWTCLQPEAWRKIPVAIGTAVPNLAVYSAVFALGMVVLALFSTWMALLARRTSTVALLALTVLMALWLAVPRLGAELGAGAAAGELLFTHYLRRLVAARTLGALVLGTPGALSSLGPIAAGLAANGAVLALACLVTLRRHELQ